MKTKEIIVQVSLSLFNENTFELSTQHALIPAPSLLNKTWLSPFPEFNAKRRYGPFATDTR